MLREDRPENTPPNVHAVTKRLRCYASFIKKYSTAILLHIDSDIKWSLSFIFLIRGGGGFNYLFSAFGNEIEAARL